MSIFTQRRSGILLHPTALSGPEGIGTLGKEARRFIDFLASAGQSLWQILPLGPVGYGFSPYSTLSAFAGSPLLIDLETLEAEGDLPVESFPRQKPDRDRIDFEATIRIKTALLRQAADRFFVSAPEERISRFHHFCHEQAAWLDDYALFQAVRNDQDGLPWMEWPEPLRARSSTALREARLRLSEEIHRQQYYQFVFVEQWQTLKAYANEKGVSVFGDIPIFVAEDSADVWAHPEIFLLDNRGKPSKVAGVPPDYFSETGQRWGNPLYDWKALKQSGYHWWIERFRWNLRLFDLVRIDHFRGFAAYWAIPADEETAMNGSWEPGPGASLFSTLKEHFSPLPVVAEDLGVITEDVEELRDRFGFPGMKILQFAFDSGPDNPYLPHNISSNSVVYTGTHDNDTSRGWWDGLGPEQHQAVYDYLGLSMDEMPWPLIRTALASVACIAILPMQDLLQLGSEARMNLPGKATGNWDWRLPPGGLDAGVANRLRELTCRYGRLHTP